MIENFKELSKKERVETYGGFAWLAAIPLIAGILQTVVSSGIAIYQAIAKKSGSVSYGGSKTITQKYPEEHATSSKVSSKKSSSIASIFTAY